MAPLLTVAIRSSLLDQEIFWLTAVEGVRVATRVKCSPGMRVALERLSENHTVELDEERKAAMVSNLLVVLCGNRDAQPVVNSGSLY